MLMFFLVADIDCCRYDFLPESYALAGEAGPPKLVALAAVATGGTWIVKPAAASCGDGIYLVSGPAQLRPQGR